MRGAGATAASWTLAVLAALALALGGALLYAEHVVFTPDEFADRAAATLQDAPVRDAVARRLAGAAIGVRPDLVAVQPIVELAARGVVGTEAFRSLVRRAAHDAHRSAFDRHDRRVTLQIRDAGVLLAAAVRRLAPGAAARIPVGVLLKVARVKGGLDGFMLALAEASERARPVKWIALGAGAMLALAALLVPGSKRAAVFRLGVATAGVGTAVALAAKVLPAIAAAQVGERDRDAARSAAHVWLDPIVPWAVAAAAVGAVVALAAASVVRPIAVMAIARRIWAFATRPARGPVERWARIAAVLCAGVAMVAWPRAVLSAAVVALGVVLLLAAVAQLLGMARTEVTPERRKVRGVPRAWGIGAVVVLVAAGGVAWAAVADDAPRAPRIGRCNGHAVLCDRRLDEVAMLGTHNAMAAAGEPGWLFAAQDAGIPQQLADGVRALTIDTHYAVPSPRGVWTDLSGDTKSRGKLVSQLGTGLVGAAERVRRRIGRRPDGSRAIFLCHGFCEVGATSAVGALRAVHRFLVTHPEEVVVLSIEDDISERDSAQLIRDSGLVDEAYLGNAKPPWPTLRQLIDRDERAIVLTENHAGPEPWIHLQPQVMQETPFAFTTPEELAAPASCDPNRGGTAGSLFLVNHWVDTPPAPRVSVARRVNAHDFLTRRLTMCRRARGKLPNVVAVDFYRQGDAARVVDELNGVG